MQMCPIHKIPLSCMGGCSAHRSNWYCPECENTAHNHRRELDQEIATNNRIKKDKEFKSFIDSLPKEHWAKYDLSAVRLGWDAAMKKQNEE